MIFDRIELKPKKKKKKKNKKPCYNANIDNCKIM